MKINIISKNNSLGLSNDIKILSFLLKKFGKGIKIQVVDFNNYKCPDADINFFLETVNNSLFKYAKYNVLIPNQEYYYRNWQSYTNKFDKILVKSKYAYDVFKTFENNIVYTGWKSLDRYSHSVTKDFNKYLHLASDSNLKGTINLISNWDQSYPDLNIIDPENMISYANIDDILKTKKNINFILNKLDDNKLNKIMNEHGVHICLSETEGFGHTIHEARLCKSIVLTLDAPPMNEYVDYKTGILVKSKKKMRINDALGSKYIFCDKSFRNQMQRLINMDLDDKIEMGENARKDEIHSTRTFERLFKDQLDEIKNSAYKIKKEEFKILEDSELPKISIITLCRKKFFKLVALNYGITNYPLDKMELIIIDENNEMKNDLPTQEILKTKNIHYYNLDEKKTISWKRNYAIEQANNDVIMFMDDDDYYPPLSFRQRVSELKYYNKNCVGCSTIGMFEINKYISLVNNLSLSLPYQERISVATLCFNKQFWVDRPFNSDDIVDEGFYFLKDRINQFEEISWDNIIVSLIHNSNLRKKKLTNYESNGCHYGWSDNLYLFITSLDNDVKFE